MKLVLMVDSFMGGAGNVMQILAGQLSRRGHDVSLLLLNGALMSPKHDLANVKVIEYPLVQNEPARTPIGRLLRYKNAVKRLITAESPDAVISFLTEYNDLSAWTIGGKIPLVISERNNPFQEKLKPQWELLRRLYYPRADKLVVQCSQFSDFYSDSVKRKISIIPNPILVPTVRHRVREDNEIRLVGLGRLHHQKNYPWMIEAMCRIHKENPLCSLKIYGDGPEEAGLQKRIVEANAQDFITLAGKTSTPHDVLANSDIYLMTSDYEGFPNALSEGMAVGLPSVTRLCHEGLRDLVEDGINGYLIPQDDMDSFVNTALRLADDAQLRSQIGLNAQKITDTYGIDQIIDRWEVALNEAVECHK
jgi:glycosyltransferase involved in cell wall biosynthesis